MQGQVDVWPKAGGGKDVAEFHRFRVFEAEDGLRIGLGSRRRDDERDEIGVFLLGWNDKKRPIVYFQPTDNFESTRELFAPIRGKGGGRSYFRGAESLPDVYAGKNVVDLADVSPQHRLREIKVVLADENDWLTMVHHGAAQVFLRQSQGLILRSSSSRCVGGSSRGTNAITASTGSVLVKTCLVRNH